MNIQRKIAFNLGVTLLLLFLAIGTVYAVPITVPTALNPGDQYRLVFVTSETRDATSAAIGDYNNFVTGVADSSTALAALDTEWFAIASTEEDSASENTGTDGGGGFPIYNLQDQLIANDYADLWDGSLLSPIQYDEDGSDDDFDVWTRVWTGTDTDGTQFYLTPEPDMGAYLGPSYMNQPITGSPLSDDGYWVEYETRAKYDEYQLYAMSAVLSVPEAQPEPVPEPSTLVLVGFGIFGLMGIRRKGRNRN